MKELLSASDALYVASLKAVNRIADLKKNGAALYPQTIELVNALADSVENYERVRWRKQVLVLEFQLPASSEMPVLAPHKGWAVLRSKRRKKDHTLAEPDSQPPRNLPRAAKKHA